MSKFAPKKNASRRSRGINTKKVRAHRREQEQQRKQAQVPLSQRKGIPQTLIYWAVVGQAALFVGLAFLCTVFVLPVVTVPLFAFLDWLVS